MKKIMNYTTTLIITVLLASCGSAVKVTNAWSNKKNPSNLQDKKVLVIARVKNSNPARVEFEEQIKDKLMTSNIDAKVSYHKLLVVEPKRKLSDEEMQKIGSDIKEKGFDVVILTTLKDYKETVKERHSGGYYAGGSYYRGGSYYGGFNTYYRHNYYYDSGVYVPEKTTTQVSKKYILETVTYDLGLPKGEQLISILTSTIEDPDNLEKIAEKYAKNVTQYLLKN